MQKTFKGQCQRSHMCSHKTMSCKLSILETVSDCRSEQCQETATGDIFEATGWFTLQCITQRLAHFSHPVAFLRSAVVILETEQQFSACYYVVGHMEECVVHLSEAL